MISINLDTIFQDKRQCAAFLQRATFGAQSIDVINFQRLGVNVWFEDQVNLPISLHRDAFEATKLAANDVDGSTTLRLGTWLQVSMQAPDQLRQRVAFALSQIFVLSQQSLGNRHDQLCSYYDVLLKHSFGQFGDLLKDVTINGLMGRYLTLSGSRKANPAQNTFPDENYAREVMQLFSLGLWQLNIDGSAKIDAQGHKIPTYTQKDVQELARVLTGWRAKNGEDVMLANARHHDTGEKIVMGQVFAANQTHQEDLDQMVNLLLHHDNTAPFVANLLIKRFGVSNPTPAYIERVAQAFIDNGQGVRGDLKAVIFAILTDIDAINGLGDSGNTSRSTQAHYGQIKEPLLMLMQQAKILDMQPNREYWHDFLNSYHVTGQAPLYAPTVFNFYLPDFSPKGEIANKGLTSPESSLLSAFRMQRIHNRLVMNIESYKNTKAKHFSYDISPFTTRIDDLPAYVTYLDERIFCGVMPERLKDKVQRFLSGPIANQNKEKRVCTSLYLIFTSPEFACQGAIA